jgi:hypothetical protein
MKNIIDKINDHILVYENNGMIPPPYRMTCKEHKELSNLINSELEISNNELSKNIIRIKIQFLFALIICILSLILISISLIESIQLNISRLHQYFFHYFVYFNSGRAYVN